MFTSLQPITYAIATIFFILSSTTILLRMYVRGFIIKNFGWDDKCMAAILFFNCGQLSILYYFLANGAGVHIMDVMTKHPEWLNNLVYALFAEELVYVWMHWIIKMAFLLFYLRIANTRIFKTLTYCTMVINTLVALSTWLIYCLQCIPLDAYFHPAAHPGVQCINRSVLAYVPAAFNIFTDCLIVVLPIRPLWQIQVSLRKRIMLISIVSLGAIVVLISSLRIIVLRQFEKETDLTYTLGKLIIISAIEIDVAIIAANGPSLKTFWTHYINSSLLTTKDGNDASHSLSNLSSGHRKRTMISRTSCHVSSSYALKATTGLGAPTADEKSLSRNSRHGSEDELWKKDSSIVVTSVIETKTVTAPQMVQNYNSFDNV